MGSEGTGTIQFFFDPMCPWAYQTSLWIREVREQRGLTIDWRFFSLEEVNREEGKKHPWEREWSYGWSLLRIAAWLRRIDQEHVDRWYLATGTALHVDGRQPHRPEVAQELLREAGLPTVALSEALADPTTHTEVRADHQWLVSTHAGFGVPTLIVEGAPIFGPVVVPAPSGPAAGRLWDLVEGWAEFPHLYEVRRPKTPLDLAHIGTAFEPYLRARAWRTIENPAP